MHRQFKLSILLAVVAGLTGCAPDMASITEPVAPEATVAAAMNASEANRVTLIRAVHFPAPGNGDVLVPSGSYRYIVGRRSDRPDRTGPSAAVHFLPLNRSTMTPSSPFHWQQCSRTTAASISRY